MKHSLLLRTVLVIFLGLTMTVARAQYVPIPDVNFANWLNGNGFGSCLTGNSVSGYQLDTTNALILSTTAVDCHYSNIHDLTGKQYFRNLLSLTCYFDSLSSLPPLPSRLTNLNCYNNQLTSLPALPATLTQLNCGYNKLTALPLLPSSLNDLSCGDNLLSSLPSLPSSLTHLDCSSNNLYGTISLPPSLTYLDCFSNQLRSLPTLPITLTSLSMGNNQFFTMPAIPANLIVLDCSSNYLDSLPALPATLTDLRCGGNHLSILPTLPASLRTLYCGINRLTNLPSLPDTLSTINCTQNQIASLPSFPVFLAYLNCSNNLLTNLPALPAHLTSLFCKYNQLQNLPSLPDSLTELDCSYNASLSCLPRIYMDSLDYFFISGTGINCIPNRFSAGYFDVNPASISLCDVNSGCDFFYNLAGTIHYSTAANCASDSLSPGNPIYRMKVQLKQGGNVIQQFYSLTSGGYSFKTPSLGTYTVDIDTTMLPISVVCPSSASRTVTLTPTDSVEIHESFGMQCSGLDYGVLNMFGSHFRPTFTSLVYISAGNNALIKYNADCGAGVSGTVTTIIDGSVQYVSPAPGALSPTSVSGNTLTYSLSDLDSLQMGGLSIVVATDTGAVVGTDVCFTTIISPSMPDMNPANDTLRQCFVIVNSWDPNEKSVYPLDTFQSGQWLTYTVEFQNTGTDTAYTVVVRDTLSPYVDASSFQYIASDHKAVIQLMGNAMTFTFPKINLVDSATNPALSTGWIQYKVKAKPNLPLTTQVKNTAYIYFDLNPAVVTNTTVNTVDTATPLAIRTVTSNNSIALYPNPSKGSFTLSTVNGQQSTNSFTITDMLGNVVMTQAINADKQTVMMPADAAGVYTLVVKGAQPIRFVVVR